LFDLRFGEAQIEEPAMKRRAFPFVMVFALIMLAQGFSVPAAPAPAAAEPLTVLLSNDDGYRAPGLLALVEAFSSVAEVYVAAPAGEQSGKGHSITTTREPIFVVEHQQPDGKTWYAIEAPPATSVRLGLENLVPKRPDVVISGINRGENLGINVYLSGTLGAAREAAITGVAAIAVSMQGNDGRDYAATAAYVRGLVLELHRQGRLRPGLFLNVNAPAGETKGVRATRLSTKPNQENYERRTSPRGRIYFWSRWRPLTEDDEDTDVSAFYRGYITLTPMTLDTTAAAELDSLRPLERTGAAAAR
jgi:5'-nucleotidase